MCDLELLLRRRERRALRREGDRKLGGLHALHLERFCCRAVLGECQLVCIGARLCARLRRFYRVLQRLVLFHGFS